MPEGKRNGVDYNKDGEHLQIYFSGHKPIQSYLRKNYAKLIIALSFDNKESRSTVAKDIIKEFFDKLPEKEIKRLLVVYEGMTEEQKRYPDKRSDE